MITHLLRDESAGVITAKCGAKFTRPPVRKDRPMPTPFDDGKVSAWRSDVTCPSCRGAAS